MRTTCVASRLFRLAAACAVTLGMSGPLSARQASDERAEALALFSLRIADYAALHRRLEGPLPPLTSTRETLRNYVARQLLADGIRTARAGAKQGDILEPKVAMVFRAVIADALKGRDVEALLAEINDEHLAAHGVWPVVNEPLPRGVTHEVPCVLLQVLPALPEDVEYRIVNHDLVLWDTHANLVVDFVPHAFRSAETH